MHEGYTLQIFLPAKYGYGSAKIDGIPAWLEKMLCKEANKAYAQYAVQDYSKPMGVATYSTLAEMPEEMQQTLPDVEELKKLL